jgi:hypothetical protein
MHSEKLFAKNFRQTIIKSGKQHFFVNNFWSDLFIFINRFGINLKSGVISTYIKTVQSLFKGDISTFWNLKSNYQEMAQDIEKSTL